MKRERSNAANRLTSFVKSFAGAQNDKRRGKPAARMIEMHRRNIAVIPSRADGEGPHNVTTR